MRLNSTVAVDHSRTLLLCRCRCDAANSRPSTKLTRRHGRANTLDRAQSVNSLQHCWNTSTNADDTTTRHRPDRIPTLDWQCG